MSLGGELESRRVGWAVYIKVLSDGPSTGQEDFDSLGLIQISRKQTDSRLLAAQSSYFP
jgi:hypothetical protein